MKHQIKKVKFAHSKSQRDAALKNMARDLILHEHIKTTKARAKAVKPFVEKLISYVKQNQNPERFILANIEDNRVSDRLVTITKERFAKKTSGFVSTYNLVNRKGDGSEMVMMILEGYQPKIKTQLKKVKKTNSKKTSDLESEKDKKSKVTKAKNTEGKNIKKETKKVK